jgi:oligopeptide transport system substrate-binding protein
MASTSMTTVELNTVSLMCGGLARAAAVAVGLTAAGCSGDTGPYLGNVDRGPTDPTTLTINGVAEPQHLDPALAGDNLSSQLIHALFEGLTTPHPRDMHPVQGVAQRWERSDDGRIYRFHLRPDARWSDGRPVVSRDFVVAWRRLIRPETGAGAAPDLYPVKNAERINQSSIRVARRDLEVRPLPGGNPGARVAKGEAVLVIERPKEAQTGTLIARFRDLPTFTPGAPALVTDSAPIGLVDQADLGPGDALLGVRATDDLTLDVELERPTPYFLDLTSRRSLVPVREDVVERFVGAADAERWTRPEHMVNNGPFVLEKWVFRDAITMKPNPHFWAKDAIRIQKVSWLQIDSAFTAMNLYKTGELDVFGSSTGIPLKSMELIEGKEDVRRFPLLISYWYELNTRVRPFDDVRVRRALDLALDKRVLERLLRGTVSLAAHYVPEITGGGYGEALAAERTAGRDPFGDRSFAPEQARVLLGEAGYPVEVSGDERRARGFPAVEVLYNEDEGHRSIAIAIQDMWRREIGVRVTLRGEEFKVMLDDVRSGRFQIVRGVWIGDFNHPHTFLETFRSSSPQNATGWSDPAFDAMLGRAAATSDPRESLRLYRLAEQIALEGTARIPLFFPSGTTLVKPWVKGFYGNGQVLDLVRWMWIDPAWKEHPENNPAAEPLELPPAGRLVLP